VGKGYRRTGPAVVGYEVAASAREDVESQVHVVLPVELRGWVAEA